MRHLSILLTKPLAPAFMTKPMQRSSIIAGSRTFGSKSDAPKFDEMMAKAYAIVSESHKHERGPWKLMTEHAISHTKGLTSPQILDLATGPGEPAKSIALAIPHAKVIATDVSEDMIATARENLQHLENVVCTLADAQDLSEFESQSMDIVTCCYGYMFPTDKAAALAETHRVLKPGGHLIATTWDKVDMMKLARDIMFDLLGEEPPPPPLNPLSLSEDGLFQSILEEAGFVSVSQSTSTYPFSYGTDKDTQKTIGMMLLHNKIDEMSETDGGIWKKADESFWANVGKYSAIEENGEMIIPENTFRLTIAKKG